MCWLGADGIHSVLRALLHPEDGGIRWQGSQLWRGVVDWPVFEGGNVMLIAADSVAKLTVYPIGVRSRSASLVAQKRATLLGDAAHPMYPTSSNGSAQTILDARCLARLLSELSAEAALKAYEAERLPKTAEVVRNNRRGGPERVLDLVAERAPKGFNCLEDVITSSELADIVGGYARLTGLAEPQ
jgi:2-polyprenyl-6-methoxyphenol hydroxylase-like FAD-dependent oxidoreductase